jgi:cell division protein ZapE
MLFFVYWDLFLNLNSKLMPNNINPLTPWQQYQKDLLKSEFQYDEDQENAVKNLQRLYDDFIQASNNKPSFISKLFNKNINATAQVQGIYFWGGVGRGKTYLVDTFFDCLPTEKKLRIHFHRFMHKVHDEMNKLNGVEDPLKQVA